jgi:hypothetical protein
MLSSRIVLYIPLVKISVHPATVEVVKYTVALSINLYLVLMVFLLISLKIPQAQEPIAIGSCA